MAVNNLSSCLHDAMDKLWFYQNIIFFEPDVVSLQSMLTKPKTTSATRLPDNSSQSLPRSKIRSHSSSPSQLKSRRKRKPRVKSYRSLLSEFENYELKGFMDLGFTFPGDKPGTYMMNMVPGLQRLGKKVDGEQEDEKRGVRRPPYLSEAWFVNRPADFLLLNLRMSPKTTLDGADMKKQLKFWAQSVAMLVHKQP